MQVILDTNILIGALMTRATPPALLYEAWKAGRFNLVSSEAQLREFARVTRYDTVKKLITASEAGTLINEIRALAIIVEKLPKVDISSDPADNFLFATAQAGAADYLVTGDKSGVLAIKRHKNTRIVTARKMLETLGL